RLQSSRARNTTLTVNTAVVITNRIRCDSMDHTTDRSRSRPPTYDPRPHTPREIKKIKRRRNNERRSWSTVSPGNGTVGISVPAVLGCGEFPARVGDTTWIPSVKREPAIRQRYAKEIDWCPNRPKIQPAP